MTKTLALGLAAFALLASTTALADQHASRGEPQADMSRSDAQARAAQRFAKMDVNSDGQLNATDREANRRKRLDAAETTAAREAHMAQRAERRGHRDGMGKAMLARAGSDQSGTISEAEFTAAALARFDRTDADNDGIVSAEERRAQRAERGAEMRGKMRDRRQDRSAMQE